MITNKTSYMKTFRLLLTILLSCLFTNENHAASVTYNLPRDNYYFYWIHGLNEDYSFWRQMCNTITPDNGNTTQLSYDSNHPGGAMGIAEELSGKIRKDKKAILIGHSAGGIIARKIAEINDNVAGVITVGSPNNGAGIVNSIVKETYWSTLNNIVYKVREAEAMTKHAINVAGFPITTLLAPIAFFIYDMTLGQDLTNAINDIYSNLGYYASSFTELALFHDLASGSPFINGIDSSKINVPIISIGGEEDKWQLYRLAGSALNMNLIKSTGLSNDYDEYVIEKYIYEALNIIADVVHYHNVAYDVLGWFSILMPWLNSTKDALIPSKRCWEGLARYINIDAHADWAKLLGAYHLEERTIRVPIFETPPTSGDLTDPSGGVNQGGNSESSDMPEGFIGYEDRVERVYVYEAHDGIVGANTAYVTNCKKVTQYTIQSINHLEMGAIDTSVPDSIDKAIDNIIYNIIRHPSVGLVNISN